MFNFINHNFNFHDRLMLKLAVSLAFFGMLRCSEYTCASLSRFDQLFDLSFWDVRVSTHNIVSIRIKSSKQIRSEKVVSFVLVVHSITSVRSFV